MKSKVKKFPPSLNNHIYSSILLYARICLQTFKIKIKLYSPLFLLNNNLDIHTHIHIDTLVYLMALW